MSDINNKETLTEQDEDMTVEIVTFEDDEGNSFSMEIVEEFEHKGVNYAVLADFNENQEHEEGCDCGDDCECEQSLYIFEVVRDAKGEEDFVAIEDDSLLEELSTIVENLLLIEDEDELDD